MVTHHEQYERHLVCTVTRDTQCIIVKVTHTVYHCKVRVTHRAQWEWLIVLNSHMTLDYYGFYLYSLTQWHCSQLLTLGASSLTTLSWLCTVFHWACEHWSDDWFLIHYIRQGLLLYVLWMKLASSIFYWNSIAVVVGNFNFFFRFRVSHPFV